MASPPKWGSRKIPFWALLSCGGGETILPNAEQMAERKRERTHCKEGPYNATMYILLPSYTTMRKVTISHHRHDLRPRLAPASP